MREPDLKVEHSGPGHILTATLGATIIMPIWQMSKLRLSMLVSVRTRIWCQSLCSTFSTRLAYILSPAGLVSVDMNDVGVDLSGGTGV